jgi:FdhD protein
MGYYGSPGDPDWQNMVNATIAADALTTNPLPPGRSFISSAACGVCGKADLVAVRCLARPISASGATVSPETVQRLDERMRAGQRVFDRTGGLHAAALFDFSGEMIVLYEDIGRHNAVDKVIGSELLAGRVPLSDRMLMVSGRAGYEIVQKAAMANIPILCSVSAPSSMAVRLAEDLNMALVGFVRGDSMNVYTHPERLSLAHPEIAGSAAA